MITDRIDPVGLALLPGTVHVTVASGSRLVFVSGQTGVDEHGKVVGNTHYEQAKRAFENLTAALENLSTSLLGRSK